MTPRPLLVPLDGSPRAEDAIGHALAVRPPGATLVLLHVVPEADQVLGRPLWDVAAWQDAARADLQRVAARLAAPVETEVVTGDAATEIVRVAVARGAALIVMTTRGLGAVGRVLFGSTADRVVRLSPLPVLLHRSDQDGGATTAPAPAMTTATDPMPETISRIVVPLDGSPLAETALPMAVELAARLAAPLWLVRAVDPGALLAAAGEEDIAEGGVIDPIEPIEDTAEALGERAQARARQSLLRAAARARSMGAAVDVDLAVLTGSPFAAIAAALTPGDLVVMTSHGRTGFTRWLLGSVAETLIRDAPAPVLLVPVPARAAATDARVV